VLEYVPTDRRVLPCQAHLFLEESKGREPHSGVEVVHRRDAAILPPRQTGGVLSLAILV
jgi:hypothetical protein